MKYYGITAYGKLVIPVFTNLAAAGTPTEAGQLIEVQSPGRIYVSTSGGTWRESGVTSFITLSDTPSAYTGKANYLPKVNSGENGLEFIAPSAVGRTTFESLDDTPAYTGNGGRIVSINSGATGLEYTAVSASLITQSVSAGSDLRITVWDGNTRNIKTGHANCYIDASGNMYGTKVYNAVFNDIADFIPVDNEDHLEIEFGKVYVIDENGVASLSSEFCQEGIIGIDKNCEKVRIPVCIGGFVLAYVDRVYKPGTPLTCTSNGFLTEMNPQFKQLYPERIVGTFFKREKDTEWNGIEVNNRHWIKVL